MKLETLALFNAQTRLKKLFLRTKKQLFVLLKDYYGDTGMTDFHEVSWPVADSWTFTRSTESENAKIQAIEIEDTSKLRWEKIRGYAFLWFDLDDLGIDFELLVFDRYGQNHTIVDLYAPYYVEASDGGLIAQNLVQNNSDWKGVVVTSPFYEGREKK